MKAITTSIDDKLYALVKTELYNNDISLMKWLRKLVAEHFNYDLRQKEPKKKISKESILDKLIEVCQAITKEEQQIQFDLDEDTQKNKVIIDYMIEQILECIPALTENEVKSIIKEQIKHCGSVRYVKLALDVLLESV